MKSRNENIAAAMACLPDRWSADGFCVVRNKLNRAPHKTLLRVRELIESNPPPDDFPVERADELLVELGLQH